MGQPLIIDVDTHVAEAADVWTARMSKKKWGDLVPEVRVADGKECWFVGSKNMGLVAASSIIRINPETGERFRQPLGTEFHSGAGFHELHPSSYDAAERLKAMDELGVHAAVVYPNLNLVVNDLHEASDDPEYKIEIIRAYNDWLIEWSSVDPLRLLPTALVAYFDVNAAAEEIYRSKEIGHRGLVMTGVPQLHKMPPLADDYWAPMWKAAEDTHLSIGFHVGANEEIMSKWVNPARLSAEGPLKMGARAVTEALLGNAAVLNDLLLSGVLPKYPDLKLVMVETGMGWVNFCLESADYHFDRYGVSAAHDEFTEPPSFYYRKQCYTTYWFEKMHSFHIDRLGANTIMFETDFPHSTSLERADVEWVVNEGLSMASDDAKEQILWRNAADLYDVPLPAVATA
jgi:predicted TIM-barrel fold metal-dependent hydrolase